MCIFTATKDVLKLLSPFFFHFQPAFHSFGSSSFTASV